MEDMLLLRPPSREFLERGPPRHLQQALETFAAKTTATKAEAVRLAEHLGVTLPPE